MEQQAVVTKICSKCKSQPADNGQRWCRRCRSDHELDRQVTQAEMAAARNWIRGGEALRRQLLERLGRAPAATYEGSQVMRWIADFPMPEYPRGSKDTDNRADV